jgi:hypothetical protein
MDSVIVFHLLQYLSSIKGDSKIMESVKADDLSYKTFYLDIMLPMNKLESSPLAEPFIKFF